MTPTTLEIQPTREIPPEACRFEASLEIGASNADAKTKPVTIFARSADPVTNWYFGRIVHDMAGMQTDAPKIPIDYEHCEAIGFSDQQEASPEGLTVKGQLVPFEDDDRASEVIFKAAAGVPYQASINFDPYRLVLEEVGEGMTVEVNGGQFTGPGVVARQWVLRGVAICLYGVDCASEVEFSRRTGADAKTRFTMTQEPNKMGAAIDTKPAADQASTEAADKAAADAQAAADKAATDKKFADDKAAADAVAAAKPPESAGQQSAAPGQRFLDAFGDQGGTWFAQGKSFDEAQTLFNAQTREKLAAQDKTIAEQRTQLAALRGEADPISFQAEQTPEQKRATELSAKGITDNYSMIAASIELPGKKK